MKKISFILLLTMLLSLFPAIPAHAETFGMLTYQISNGMVTITDCDESASGTIDIPSTIECYPVTAIGDNAFGLCAQLSEIKIPESVTSIADYAFSDCTSLTCINIPQNVAYIGLLPFNSCSSLEIINIDANNQKFSSDNGILFNKEKTELIYYPLGKTENNYDIPSNVTTISDWSFYSSTALTSINIPDSVTTIGDYVFCSTLTSVEIPDSVTAIGNNAFDVCFHLTNVNVSPENNYFKSEDGILLNKNGTKIYCYPKAKPNEAYSIPNTVQSINDFQFYECNNLKTVAIPESVTNIGDFAFCQCWNLESVTMQNRIESIERSAFNNCTKLKNISVPESLTSIGEEAFWNTGITSFTIPSKVTEIGENAFYTCDDLISINVDDANEVFTSKDGVLFSKDYSELIFYPEGKKDNTYSIPDTVTNIHERAFSTCQSLESISIPASVSKIGSEAFSFCGSLNSVNIPKSITSIGDSAFEYCDNLKLKVYSNSYGYNYAKDNNIPCVIMDVVVPIESLTYTITNDEVTITGCDHSASGTLEIPSTIEGYPVTAIGENAFSDSPLIYKITLPDSVTTINYGAFWGCGFTSIDLSKNVKTIANETFNFCDNLVSINVDSQNEYYKSLDGVLFNKDQTIILYYPQSKQDENYIIPNTVQTIQSHTFMNCKNLRSVTIPDSVTTIIDNSFVDSYSLLSINISKNVTAIGYHSFDYCQNLESINVDPQNEYYNSTDGVLFNKDKTELLYYPKAKPDETYIVPCTVQNIGTAFEKCKNLVEITIPEGIKTIADLSFFYCDKLTNINLPNTLTMIDFSAFIGCNSLKNINIPKRVTTINHLRYLELQSINVDAENEYYSSIDGVLFTKDKKSLICYPIGKTGDQYIVPDSTIDICDLAFSNSLLRTIELPNSVLKISNLSFNSCNNLTSITIPNGVLSIGDDAFRSCSSLTSLNIPKNVESIGNYAFEYCDNLTLQTYPKSYGQSYAISNNIPYTTLPLIELTNITNQNDEVLSKENLINLTSVKMHVGLLDETLENPALFIAFYDNNNKMLSMVPYDQTLQSGEITIPVSVPNNTYKMKIICWDNFNSMTELMNPYEI